MWILDSDCVVTRPDALTAPLARHPDAAIVGEQHWDPWHTRSRLELYSLLATTDALRHEGVAPFSSDGDPAWDLLTSAERAGLRIESFPFTQDGHLVHLGRASLAALFDLDDRTNPLFEWAIDHHDPHFGAVAAAPARYAAVVQQFEREVGPELDLATALRT